MESGPSERKKKSLPSADLRTVYDSILDLLIKVKPSLGNVNDASTLSVLRDLQEITSLGESFSHGKGKAKMDWQTYADDLDKEGVHLWNTSTYLRHNEKDDKANQKVFAALRLAGYRLIEAGMESKPSPEGLVHLVQLASKAASALAECGSSDQAASVLEAAAKFEELLRHVESENETDLRNKASAITTYFSGRMEAAIHASNESVAYYMLQQATDGQRLSLLPAAELELLASKVLAVGKRVLKGPTGTSSQVDGAPPGLDPKRGHAAAKWFQSGLKILDRVEDEGTLGLREIKRATMRSLARSFFAGATTEPKCLESAEATIDELFDTLSSPDDDVGESQQLSWMKVAVLKKRNASEGELSDAFRNIVETMHVDEEGVTSVLSELHTLSDKHPRLLVSVTQLLLGRALPNPSTYSQEAVGRILVNLLVYCKGRTDEESALHDLDMTFTVVADTTDFMLEKVPTLACQSLMMSLGERLYSARKWIPAASWYLLCTHPCFKIAAASSFPKCLRKAALCYIQEGDYAKASTIVQRCPEEEATTHYVRLLTATHQGLEEEAVAAVRRMVKADDFDPKLLLLATQLAHESHLKSLLLVVLEALLESMREKPDAAGEVEVIVLIRCLIRLILNQLKDPVASTDLLVKALLSHMRTARNYVKEAIASRTASTLSKDISWLWRTAYNASVEGCNGWDEDCVCELFDIAVEFMDAYQSSAVAGFDREITMHKIMASFAAVCGRVFSSRRASKGLITMGLRQQLLVHLSNCQSLVKAARQQPSIDEVQGERLDDIYNTSLVFQVEQLCHLGLWDQTKEVIQSAAHTSTVGPSTLEMIADILWIDQTCPSDVLYTALETILHVSLDRQHLSLPRFSRWLRAICTILLARNRSADRINALEYMKQAADLLDGQKEEANEEHVYPDDERQWLLHTAFNTGVDVFRQSSLEEAKSWFELAAVLSRHVDNGKETEQKISKAYSDLLSRYGPGH